MPLTLLILMLLACWGRDAYILHGTVVEVRSGALVIDHGRLKDGTRPGKDTYLTRGTTPVSPGDRVTARVLKKPDGHHIDQIRILGGGVIEGPETWPLEGVVVRVEPPETLIVDHEAIEGFMEAMVMPLKVDDPAVLETIGPGDYITGTLEISDRGTRLGQIEKMGHGDAPVLRSLLPIKPGQTFPRLDVVAEDGTPLVVGKGQDRPTALTFLYTSCPIPEYCPATVARLQALQQALGDNPVRIVALTLDPATDTEEVLAAFARDAGADPSRWRFARADKPTLQRGAMRAALQITADDDAILHNLRLLVLDGEGRLIERYDDNRWPLERVKRQLLTGEPLAPPNSSGTVTP